MYGQCGRNYNRGGDVDLDVAMDVDAVDATATSPTSMTPIASCRSHLL